jgi:NADH-quinone oxidoreductase subunit G
VNNEGRAQRFYKAIVNKNQVKESWRWIEEIMRNKNLEVIWNGFDDLVSSLVLELSVFSKLKEYMPGSDFRMLNAKIPRQTFRYSGRTAINANVEVSELKIPQDTDSPLAFSMEGQPERPASSLVPFYWTPGWNSVQSMYNYLNQPNGSMKGGDPGIRLIEPTQNRKISYFNINSKNVDLKEGEWLIVPVYQIFGSDELSSVGPSLAQRIREPFVFLNQRDAEILSIEDNNLVRLLISKIELKLKVKIENSLQPGLAGLSVNLPDVPFIDLPCHGKIFKL